MDTSHVKVSFNWPRVGGCEFSKVLQIRSADPDIFIRPTLDDLVNLERAILLNKDECTESCEMLIELNPCYKIQAFSLVCNVNKVEIFQGNLKEYLETVYGVIEDESDDLFKTYRYDVEVDKSGITELTIKFLTHAPEVCLFGIILQTAPNPNGITTLLPNTSKPLTDKCQTFFEFIKANSLLNITERNSDPSILEQHSQRKTNQAPNMIQENEGHNSPNNNKLDTVALQNYIDNCFRQMEDRLNKRLKLMEERQMEKMDCLLRKLENLDRNKI